MDSLNVTVTASSLVGSEGAAASSRRLDFRDETQPRLDASCELAVQTLGASDEPLVLATTQAATWPLPRHFRDAS